MRRWGASDLVVVKPDWQDPATLRPAQAPPAAVAGGAAAFSRLATAAGILAPSQALTLTLPGCTGFPNNAYQPGDRITGADGAPKALAEDLAGAPLCGGVPMPRYLLAPDAARRIGAAEATTLAGLGAGGSFLPVLSAWNPAWPWPGAEDTALDQRPTPLHPATVGEAVRAVKQLAQALAPRGPVLGEGSSGYFETGYDSFYAGYFDGLFRSLATGSPELAPADGGLVIPDYELAIVRPALVGFGMGPYADFFGAEAVGERLTDAQLDTLRAFSLAYGHAGAWWRHGEGPGPLTEAEEAKEYFLLSAIAGRTQDLPLASVAYMGPGDVAYDLSAAFQRDQDLANPRLRIAYGGGLLLWINHSAATWPVTLDGQPYALPRHGWLATGPEGFLAYSALVEGRRVDYLWSPEWVLMDGRGQATHFGSDIAVDLKVRLANGRVVEEQPDGSLRVSGN
jgi:hypothetical protein